MVPVMQSISNMITILTLTSLIILITITNPSMQLSPQNLVLATTQQRQEDSSSENNDGSLVGNKDSGTTQDNVNSEQSEGSNGEQNSNDDSDSSSSDQSNICPDTNGFADVPTYIGQDGCQYPCPAVDSLDQSNIPQSCPVESPSQTTTAFVINEERPIQSEEPFETLTNELQENNQPKPNQNTFVNPRINSDTTSDISTNRETMTTQKTFNPAGQFKPGSGQTELTIPGKSDGLARPYTPGAANDKVVGIPTQPNTNPLTQVDPENIQITIPDKAYLTVITKMINFYTAFLKVSDFKICVQSTIQTDGNSRTVDAIPRCANGSASGVQYTVQAPGSITIWVDNLDELGVRSLMIETPNLSNYINAHESKTSTIYISPYQS